jgi:ribosomal-protein-alanine N-acetyltransferase
VRLRAANPADAAALAAVHTSGFETPWTGDDFARFLADPVTFGRVAETADGDLAGFILCRTIAGEAEILTVVVATDFRRRGVGMVLLAEAMAVASARAEAMFLEVAADNPGAIALYTAAGFEAVGRRAGYYGRLAGGSVDAIVMRRALDGARSGP